MLGKNGKWNGGRERYSIASVLHERRAAKEGRSRSGTNGMAEKKEKESAATGGGERGRVCAPTVVKAGKRIGKAKGEPAKPYRGRKVLYHRCRGKEAGRVIVGTREKRHL